MVSKEYIGDGVYAAHDGYCITLTTENGGVPPRGTAHRNCRAGAPSPSNTIYLEPDVLRRLVDYNKRARNELTAQHERGD